MAFKAGEHTFEKQRLLGVLPRKNSSTKSHPPGAIEEGANSILFTIE
jgi:hypothetical protein